MVCCAQALVFEDRIAEVRSGTKAIVNVSSATQNYAAVVARAQETDASQIQMSDAHSVVVGFSYGRFAQSELMNLPTVAFRGRRSTGLPKGKMIVIRKNA